jgi:hypothetical protein
MYVWDMYVCMNVCMYVYVCMHECMYVYNTSVLVLLVLLKTLYGCFSVLLKYYLSL